MKIGVSIVSFNTGGILIDFLNKLTKDLSVDPKLIWVVDNASSDGSADLVEKSFSKVNLIRSNKNLGFAAGQNIALKELAKSEAEAIVVVNSDIQLENDCFQKLAEVLKTNPNTGMVSPKIIGYDNHLHSNGGDYPVGLALISWLFNLEVLGIKSSFHRLDADYFAKPRIVDWVGGTLMMLKPEVLTKVGYFSEDYFMYFEDCEWCYRINKKGFQISLEPSVVIKHQSGASSENPRLNQWSGEMKGLIKFYQQHYPLWSPLVWLLAKVSVILRMLAFGLLGKWQFANTYSQVLVKF
jgi:GT2 family glycosyltransferase